MTVKELPGDKVYQIKIPSITKDRTEIPKEIRQKVIEFIEESFSNMNGGSTRSETFGTYASKRNEYVREIVSTIESHGNNPFSKKDIEYLNNLLNQECLMFEVISGRQAFLIDSDNETSESPETIYHPDGSYSLVYDKGIINGEPSFFIIDFDESGAPMVAGEYLESDFHEPVEIPDEVMEYMEEQVQKYKKKNNLM